MVHFAFAVSGLPRLALVLLFGMFLLMLCDGPSPAGERGAIAVRPGQVIEAITPAAIVVSTVHYQATLGLTCSGANCFGSFPRPGVKRRLNVTRMSCLLIGAAGSAFSVGYIALENADNSQVTAQFLPVDHSAASGFHTLNRTVDMQVGSSQHIYVQLGLVSGLALGGTCGASGTLDTLQ